MLHHRRGSSIVLLLQVAESRQEATELRAQVARLSRQVTHAQTRIKVLLTDLVRLLLACSLPTVR